MVMIWKKLAFVLLLGLVLKVGAFTLGFSGEIYCTALSARLDVIVLIGECNVVGALEIPTVISISFIPQVSSFETTRKISRTIPIPQKGP
jgi:hypothetical protein